MSDANAIARLEHDPSVKCQIRTQNAVKDKTGNSLKTMGQTIGKYQQA